MINKNNMDRMVSNVQTIMHERDEIMKDVVAASDQTHQQLGERALTLVAPEPKQVPVEPMRLAS